MALNSYSLQLKIERFHIFYEMLTCEWLSEITDQMPNIHTQTSS